MTPPPAEARVGQASSLSRERVSASSPPANVRQFGSEGFQIFPELVAPRECDSLIYELSALFETRREQSKSRIGGLRNLLRACPAVAEFAVAPPVSSLLEEMTGREVFSVRAIFFDKTPAANWRVPWHQDLTIAVAARVETPGFTGWSLKDEIWHVQPPGEILAGMVTLRLHLDDCDAANGALKVIPGTHARGKIDSETISNLVATKPSATCEVVKGGALLMRPLLLHSSAPAANPAHRRVLHIEYASHTLPNGLAWFDS